MSNRKKILNWADVPVIYGDLTLQIDPNEELYATKEVRAICVCGNQISLPYHRLQRGNTKSCGTCQFKSKEVWLNQKWGNVRLDPHQNLPFSFGGTHKKFKFICDCTQEFEASLNDVLNGRYKTCGHCSVKPISYWRSKQWGQLRLGKCNLDSISDKSPTRVEFICVCGNTINIPFYRVTTGNTRSCGHCSSKPKDHWLAKKWGKLRLDDTQQLPDYLAPRTHSPYTFLCTCGGQITCPFSSVTSGNTQSCGCAAPGLSLRSPARSIFRYINDISNAEVKFSHWIKHESKKLEYDIYIPSKKLAIEYHGLYWHMECRVGKKDFAKFIIATKRGDRLIQIYSDEWRDKKEIMKGMIRSLIQPRGGKRIKPIYEVHYKTPLEARTFLDKYHYLGAASGCITIIAKHGEAIVGVWVFMKREDGVILWHRACWHPAYKAWNPHEKALKLALPELKLLGFTKMITFSDNRFHTGQLYEKLGFTFETEIPPNYYYTDGVERKSKYVFRVKSGISEKAEAEAKGWYRVWDSGKRRYALSIIGS